MSEHPNLAVARRLFDAFDASAMEAMSGALADDVVWHEIGNPEPVRGKAALAARFSGGASDYEIKAELHDLVGGDDHVVALVSATATRAGRTLSYRVAEIYHLKDGKITERWAFSDDTAAINAFFGS